MNTDLLTFSGQLLLLLGALLGAGGGLKYLVEPLLRRSRLRKVIGTNLSLSCYELRSHLEVIVATLAKGDDVATRTRDALMKIPTEDAKGQADWYVKTGYSVVITAYKIAAFSSWMRIYQITVLQAILLGSRKYITNLFTKFYAYKVAAGRKTVLWYGYIDAIGEKLIIVDGELRRPMYFSEFLTQYQTDREFLLLFDQLHMFIHFIGREGHKLSPAHRDAVAGMINTLREIEDLIRTNHETLLPKFKPDVRSDDSTLPVI